MTFCRVCDAEEPGSGFCRVCDRNFDEPDPLPVVALRGAQTVPGRVTMTFSTLTKAPR